MATPAALSNTATGISALFFNEATEATTRPSGAFALQNRTTGDQQYRPGLSLAGINLVRPAAGNVYIGDLVS